MRSAKLAAKIAEATSVACDNIDELLCKLGVEYYRSGRRIMGVCPVHCGDNRTAFNLYPEGYSVRGNWVCNTHHCEKKFSPYLTGLIHGILLRRDKTTTFYDALKFLANFVGYNSINDVPEPSPEELIRRAAARNYNKLDIIRQESKYDWTREQIRSRLEIPAPYYIDRGFSPEVLDKYDVGYSKRLNKVIVPIYDNDYTKCIGWTERAINGSTPKWIHSEGFNTSNCLYNYWFARHYLYCEESRNDTIIIVEGPSDVWRLAQNNIHNAVATFGVAISQQQRIIIETSRALSLIVLYDNDEAGRPACQQIKKDFGRQFRLYFPTFKLPDGKDPGDELNTDYLEGDMQLAIFGVKGCLNG